MFKRSLRIVPVLMSLVLAGCSSARREAPPVMLARDADVQSASFQTYWQAQLPLRRGDTVDRCFLRDDNLYVTTRQGDFYALKADQGLLRWTHQVAQPDYTIFPPQHLDSSDQTGPVAVATSSRLFVIDRYSGDIVHSSPMTFAPATSFVGDQQRLFAGGADGNLYSLLWRHHHGDAPLERWRLASGSVVTSTPVIKDDILYFATVKGQVASCSALDKTFGWIARVGPIAGDIAVDETRVYAASTDSSVYALHRNTGAVMWRTRFQHMLVDGPVLKGSTIYQFCPGEGLMALDAGDGRILWTRKDAVSLLSATGGEAALLGQSGTVEVVDIATGDTVRSFDAGPVHASAVNLDDDAVYLAYGDGRVACHRPRGVPYLRRQEVEAAKGVLDRAPLRRGGPTEAGPASKPATRPDPLRSDRDRPNP